MNTATALIEGNGRSHLFSFETNGDVFTVFAKQTPSECRTGRLGIFIKANNEKAQRIGFYHDSGTIADLAEYAKTELLETED